MPIGSVPWSRQTTVPGRGLTPADPGAGWERRDVEGPERTVLNDPVIEGPERVETVSAPWEIRDAPEPED